MSTSRYDRHKSIIGEEGFRRLRGSTVLIVGVGGLGSVASYYLAGAGVGKLILVDKDTVDITNLNRQILYTEEDVGKPKVIAARKRLLLFNKEVIVEAYDISVFDSGFEPLVKKSDVIVDGLDNWEARLRVNELAVRHGKPFVHAAVEEWYGQLLTVLPGKGPCLNCLFQGVMKKQVPRVIPSLPGVVGSLEASEAIKILTGIGEVFYDRILHMDFKYGVFSEIKVKRNPECPFCSGL